MYHSLNERLIEEFITVDNSKSGLLGVPMSSLFAISQQMYFGLNQEYNARAYIMENLTQKSVLQCNHKMLAMRHSISAASEDAWCKKAKERIESGANPQLLAEKDLDSVMPAVLLFLYRQLLPWLRAALLQRTRRASVVGLG